MRVQRPKRLRIHKAPEMCHIDLEVTFTRTAMHKVSCWDATAGPRSSFLSATAGGARKRVVTTYVRNTTTKDTKLPPIILLILSLVIFVCAFGYTMYRR